jgi:predicted CxxxxCH...CXXCH cytochrome family protein
VCNQCHSLERSYGNGPASCHDCHTHEKGQPWMDKKEPGYHGASVGGDAAQCSACHANPAVTTKCASCHFDDTTGSKTPDPGWTHVTTPHEGFTPAQGAVCTTCHTASRSYGNGPAACHDCHTHDKGQPWMDSKETGYHGASTPPGAAQCSSCHDNPAVTTKCASCHYDDTTGSKTPDPGWTHGAIPHDNSTLTITPSQMVVCATCHASSRSYGNGPAVCHDCHTHDKGQPWMDKKETGYHGASVGGDAAQCSACHANPAVTTKCADCHYDDTTGSKTPDPGWTHGTTPHDNATLTLTAPQAAVCVTCHEASRSYGNGPAACHDCHKHPRGQPWLDYKSSEFHGTSTMQCSQCHNLSTECSTCHFGSTGSMTPDPGWTHGDVQHDGTVLTITPVQETVCATCHALERSYGNGPAACHDCHTHDTPFPNHGATARQDLVLCKYCHASPSGAGPGSDPRFNVPRGALAAGCESSGCHAQKTAHPVPWKGADATSHQTAGNMENACVLCHGATLAGSAGPACSTCHTQGLPTGMKDCSSCHNKPPSSGRHAEHNALAEVATVCSTCHSGAGSQTASHQNGTVEMYIAGFNAKSGTASFSAAGKTCSNVSCHGGQVTPRWDTGAINVNTQCTACHSSSTTQYNSYVSGEHSKHVGDKGYACTECHDTTKLATVHFNDLATTAMTQAAQTILTNLNYNGSSCLFTCHLNNEGHDRGMTW